MRQLPPAAAISLASRSPHRLHRSYNTPPFVGSPPLPLLLLLPLLQLQPLGILAQPHASQVRVRSSQWSSGSKNSSSNSNSDGSGSGSGSSSGSWRSLPRNAAPLLDDAGTG